MEVSYNFVVLIEKMAESWSSGFSYLFSQFVNRVEASLLTRSYKSLRQSQRLVQTKTVNSSSSCKRALNNFVETN